jgi:phosphate-selective porin OprO and OprP
VLRSVFLASLILAAPAVALGQQPAPKEPPTDTKVDASRGGVTISHGVNSLTIGARVQFRWTLDDREEFDGDTTGAGVGHADGALTQFDVPRLRMTFSGGAFRPWLRYSFQFEFSRTSGEGGSRIKDAVIEFRPVGKPYRIAGGQFKAPFGLQQMTSSGRLQFVDRAITDAKFNPGRDMGVMVSGTVAERRVGYDVGVFNGAGESLRQTTETPLWVARAYFDPFGPYTLSESSADASEKAVLHLGVAARGGKQIRGRTAAGVVEQADNQSAYDVEFAFKARRFYSTAEYFLMSDEQEAPVAGADVDSHGFHVQAGYMLVAKKVEVGALYAWIDPNTDVDDAAVREVRAVFGYYWQAHNLKLQADAGQLHYDARFSTLSARARQGLPALGPRLVSGKSLADTQVRVQLQLAF